MAIKVFRVNDYEWWAGESAEEVLAACMKESGLSADEVCDGPDNIPEQLSDKTMNSLMYLDDQKLNKKVTFATALKHMIKEGVSFPCLFAATDY